MGYNKVKCIFSLLFTIVIMAIEIFGFVQYYPEEGMHMFIYYTQCSNLFLLLASALWFVILFMHLRDGTRIPKFAYVLKYAATATVAQTLVVVISILAPFTTFSFHELMFEGSCLYFHLLGPVVGIVAFVTTDCGPELIGLDNVFALIPTLIYAGVSIYLNIINVWYGPYPFLYVHDQSIGMSIMWFIIIVGGAFLIALLLRKMNRRCNKEYVYR